MLSTSEEIEQIKCVVVGDGGSGKTSLLVVYAGGKFPELYIPTVFDNYISDVAFKDKKARLTLVDTAGQEDYDRLRPLFYDHVDVVIACYDVTSQASFDNVRIQWIPELRLFCPCALVIVVGCKTDLRPTTKANDIISDDVNMSSSNYSSLVNINNKVVTTAEGEQLAKEVEASAFLECSAKLNLNVGEVFTTAARLMFQQPSQWKCCNIL